MQLTAGGFFFVALIQSGLAANDAASLEATTVASGQLSQGSSRLQSFEGSCPFSQGAPRAHSLSSMSLIQATSAKSRTGTPGERGHRAFQQLLERPADQEEGAPTENQYGQELDADAANESASGLPRRSNKASTMQRGLAAFVAALRAKLLPGEASKRAVELLQSSAQKALDAGGELTPGLALVILALLLVASVVGLMLIIGHEPSPPPPPPAPFGQDDGEIWERRAQRHSLRLPSAAVPRGSSVAGPKAAEAKPKEGDSPTLLTRSGAQKEELSPQRAGTKPSVLAREVAYCPDLVVPSSCECVLLVPIQPLSLGPLKVCDTNGLVVLQAAQTLDRSSVSRVERESPEVAGSSSMSSNWTLTLSAGSGELLAKCSTTRFPSSQSPRPAEFHLLSPQGVLYGNLIGNEAGDQFKLKALTGAELFFWGSFDLHAINVTDSTGKLLATTELCAASFDPAGEYYRLRVAPLGDVGAVLMCLFCVSSALKLPESRQRL